MVNTDPQPPIFSMNGAREVLSQSAGAVQIERQIQTIEHAVNEAPPLSFDMCRSLIETVCKTILKDRNAIPEGNPDLPELFRQTLRHLVLLPESHIDNPQLRDTLRKTVNGLQTVVQGLCELRNQEGMAHGREADVSFLSRSHALMAARATDSIIHFLFSSHKGHLVEGPAPGLEYNDNPEFNDFLDESNDTIIISGLKYTPSEVLYNIDREAYREFLQDFQDEVAHGSDEIEGVYA